MAQQSYTEFIAQNPNWQSWPTVTTPSGNIYYKMPGTGYLFDATLSQQRGRVQIFQDPTKANEAAKTATDPIRQFGIPAAAALGTYGAKLGIDYLTKSPAQQLADAKASAELAKIQGAAPQATQAIQPISPAINGPATGAGQSFLQGVGGVGGGDLGGTSALDAPADFSVPADFSLNAAPLTSGAESEISNIGAGGIEGAAPEAAPSLLGTAAPYLGAAGAALGLYELGSNWGHQSPGRGALEGAGTGASIGTMILPGWGTAIGAGVGGLVGLGAGMVHTGKSGAQGDRDMIRSGFQQAGIADPNYNVKLADGTTFNVGLDGHTAYNNQGKNVDGKTTRNAWDVDFSNPLASQTVQGLTPLVSTLMPQADQTHKEQAIGMLANAVMSNAKNVGDLNANIALQYQRMGIKPPDVTKMVPVPSPADIPATPDHPILKKSAGKQAYSSVDSQAVGKALASRFNERNQLQGG